MLDSIRSDLRQGWRSLLMRPGLTTTVLAILGIGIAASVVAFSLVHHVLLRELTFDRPEELVAVWEHNTARGRDRNVVSPANFLDWRERNDVFREMAAFISISTNVVAEDGTPIRARSGLVSDHFFDVFATRPELGRTFEPDEHFSGSAPVVVLSHSFWQSRLGGAVDVLERRLDIDGSEFTVLGVMPESFVVDFGPSVAPYGSQPDFWVPYPMNDSWRRRAGRSLMVVARLEPGATVDTARASMIRLGDQLAVEYPDFNGSWTANVVPLREQMVGSARLLLGVLAGAVALVLLIACGNVAGLLLGKALGRGGEMAVRSALGASRWRLVRQLLAESALLALLAGLVGIFASGLLMGTAVNLFPDGLPRSTEVTLSPSVVLFAAAATLLTLVLFGLLPALLATRRPGNLLRAAAQGSSPARERVRSLLVAAEVALAVVLLVGAGLLLRSMKQLTEVDPGFSAGGVLTYSASLPRRTTATQALDFWQRLLDESAALPGVAHAGAVSVLPLDGVGSATSYWAADRELPPRGEEPAANVRIVAGDYFGAMGIALVEGRNFDARDRPPETDGDTETSAAARRPVIVNRALTQSLWPGESPLGKELRVSWGEWLTCEIVGVVADVHQGGLDTPPRAALYWPLSHEPWPGLSVVLSTSTEAGALAEPARAALGRVDPTVPMFRLRPLERLVDGQLSEKRFLSATLLLFASSALLLAALGIYGVTSLAVRQRTRELGLRMALGASPARVRAQVLGRVATLAALGLATGLGLSLALGRLLGSLLFGVDSSDPATFAAVATVLGLTALAAAFLPARRAARIAPSRALRED